MYGLAAITAKNGWAMALAGALIVMSGLAVLAAVISQLQRLAQFIENRKAKPSQAGDAAPADKIPSSLDMDEMTDRYRRLARQLGDTFELTQLYRLAMDSGFPHVHLSIRSLRESGWLVEMGDGLFAWRNE